MKKWNLVVFVLIFSLLAAGMNVGASDDYEIVFSDLNPEYEKHLADLQVPMTLSLEEESEENTSYIPSPLKEADALYALENTDDTLPESYDARTEGRITPVGNQGRDGVCWAFAGNSGLEAALMPKQEFNFSEQHVRFALSANDGNEWGYDRDPADGGNFNMYAMYLMRWSGPVLESEDPYDLGTESRDASVTDGFEEQFHVQGFIELPNPQSRVESITDEQRAAQVNLVKQYVMKYGSVFTSIYYNKSYLNSSTNGYYYREKNYYNNTMYRPSNHALSIVGWDDHYSKENFSTQPESDGAFIIKNSWGTGFGDNGYFYLSYEDAYAGWNIGVISRVDKTDNFDHIYQYDPFCLTGSFGYSQKGTGKIVSEASYANVFETEGKEEALKAVSVYVLAGDTTCTLYLSQDGELKQFEQMTKIGEKTVDAPGYHTIDLSQEIPLTGEKFAVAVHLKSTQPEKQLIPLEMPLKSGAITNNNCKANAGESYVSYNSSFWQDVTTIAPNSNVLLKAYTVDLPVETEVGFADSDGHVLSGWSNGDEIKADTYYYNDDNETVTAKVYLGLYQGDKLISIVGSDELTVEPGKSVHLVTDLLNIPQSGDYQVKQFIWQADTLLPLVGKQELQKETK